MQYAMSDIHGDFTGFIQMLERIQFNENDTLYLIGDLIDKNLENLKMLDFAMEHKNVYHLKGNHEFFMEQSLKNKEFAKEWKELGGEPTLQELSLVSEGKKEEYLNYLNKLPFYIQIKINEKDYLLTHTGYRTTTVPVYKDGNIIDIKASIERMIQADPYEYLRYSELFGLPAETHFDVHCIVGHVPTFWVRKDKKAKIQKEVNFTNIDCGAGHKNLGGRLACLRLDDFQEFYSE